MPLTSTDFLSAQWGNLHEEVDRLGLPDDLANALRDVHLAASKADMLRNLVVDGNFSTDDRLEVLGKAFQHIHCDIMPAARLSLSAVERELIEASESLKGSTAPNYGETTVRCAHAAAMLFADAVRQNSSVHGQESDLPLIEKWEAIRRRVLAMPPARAHEITEAMKAEAIVAAKCREDHRPPSAAAAHGHAGAGSIEDNGFRRSATTKQIKEPPKEAFEAWRLKKFGGWNQHAIADKLGVKQWKVSRMIARVNRYGDQGGKFPPPPDTATKPVSVDPRVIEMGEREDGRTKRQRQRSSADSYDGDDDE
jgi:hypothetical protein